MASNDSTKVGRLEGRVALITGGTSGIGKATAIAFAQEGANVVFTGRREKLGSAVVAEIEATGGQANFITTDHTQPADCRRAVEQVIADFGRLDVLFNNAGIVTRGTAEETSDEDWTYTFDLNVTLVWRMSTLRIAIHACPRRWRNNQQRLPLGLDSLRECCSLLRQQRCCDSDDQGYGVGPCS